MYRTKKLTHRFVCHKFKFGRGREKIDELVPRPETDQPASHPALGLPQQPPDVPFHPTLLPVLMDLRLVEWKLCKDGVKEWYFKFALLSWSVWSILWV